MGIFVGTLVGAGRGALVGAGRGAVVGAVGALVGAGRGTVVGDWTGAGVAAARAAVQSTPVKNLLIQRFSMKGWFLVMFSDWSFLRS